MKLFKFGVALALVIAIAIVALANIDTKSDNPANDKMIIEDGLRTYKEETCVDNFGNISCKEDTYVECKGVKYKAPVMTGYVVKEKVFVPEYVEKEKIVFEEKKLIGEERPSPADRIIDYDVNAYSSKVVIDIENAKSRKFIDSNSMDPLIDEGTTTIEVKPKNSGEIKVGDIIAYDVKGYDYAFVHRVIEIGNDEKGVYFVTKGDNYWKEDPMVRFSDIEGIVVGILY